MRRSRCYALKTCYFCAASFPCAYSDSFDMTVGVYWLGEPVTMVSYECRWEPKLYKMLSARGGLLTLLLLPFVLWLTKRCGEGDEILLYSCI